MKKSKIRSFFKKDLPVSDYLLNGIIDDIQKHGNRVFSIIPDESQDFCYQYTVGNTCYGLPELVAFFPHNDLSYESLMRITRKLGDGYKMNDDLVITDKLVYDVPIELRRLRKCTFQYQYLIRDFTLAHNFFKKKPKVIQVVLPDSNMLFADHPNCDVMLSENIPTLFS